MNPRTCAAALLAVILAAPATAQRAREEESLAGAREELEARGRELLHRGAPLELVGVGAGDADVLTRTPALQRASFGVAVVDRETLLERKLALYGDRAHFDSAPRAAVPGPTPTQPRRGPSERNTALEAAEGDADERSGWHTSLIALVLAGLAGAGWVLQRRAPRRRSGRA